jgi:hypothetical protein
MIVAYMMAALLLAGQKEEGLSLLARTDLTCPACRKTFVTVVCPQTNTRCGIDRDLFARALGPQPEFYLISTCPHCGYSGYLADFNPDRRLPADVRRKVVEQPGLKLPAGFTPDSDPRELDATYRYALAVTCYRWQQKSEEAIAWLHLRASWIEREEGAVLPPEDRLKRTMAYTERWRPPLGPTQNQADVEMQTCTRMAEALAVGRFNRYQKPYVDLTLALMLRRHGENRQARVLLDRLWRIRDRFPDSLQQSISRMNESIRKETAQQQEAAAAFERAVLTDRITPANRGPACYLLGELTRRLGRDADAVEWFDRAIAEAALPADLRGWAVEQRQWCQTSQPSPDER